MKFTIRPPILDEEMKRQSLLTRAYQRPWLSPHFLARGEGEGRGLKNERNFIKMAWLSAYVTRLVNIRLRISKVVTSWSRGLAPRSFSLKKWPS